MNGSPHRLDLAVERARRAVVDGLRPVDRLGRPQHRASSTTSRWGVSQARRAWVEPADVLNTRSRADLLDWVGRQAGARVTGRVPSPPMHEPRSVRGTSRGRPARPGARSRSPSSGCRGCIEPPAVWFVAILLLGAMVLGTLQVLGRRDRPRRRRALGVPVESLILPAVAAVACLGAIRLVPFGLWLAPALARHRLLVERASRSRRGSCRRPAGSTRRADHGAGHDPARRVPRVHRGRRHVPGGLAQPGTSGAAGGPLPRGDLLILATGTPSSPALLGYRAAALRVGTLRDALWSAATYAVAIAIGAAALRFDGDPAADGPGAADADVLPVGRLPRARRRPAAATRAGSGRRSCSSASASR